MNLHSEDDVLNVVCCDIKRCEFSSKFGDVPLTNFCVDCLLRLRTAQKMMSNTTSSKQAHSATATPMIIVKSFSIDGARLSSSSVSSSENVPNDECPPQTNMPRSSESEHSA